MRGFEKGAADDALVEGERDHEDSSKIVAGRICCDARVALFPIVNIDLHLSEGVGTCFHWGGCAERRCMKCNLVMSPMWGGGSCLVLLVRNQDPPQVGLWGSDCDEGLPSGTPPLASRECTCSVAVATPLAPASIPSQQLWQTFKER